MTIRQERQGTTHLVEIEAIIILIAFNLLLLISCSFLTTRCMDSTQACAFTYTQLISINVYSLLLEGVCPLNTTLGVTL